jgi:hypothetical protein
MIWCMVQEIVMPSCTIIALTCDWYKLVTEVVGPNTVQNSLYNGIPDKIHASSRDPEST